MTNNILPQIESQASLQSKSRDVVKPKANKSSSHNEAEKFSVPNKDIQKKAPKSVENKSIQNSDVAEVRPEKKSLENKSVNENQPHRSEDRVTRKKALEVFANKMQSEFNVQPEEVMLAYSQMDQDELAMAPILSAHNFIDKLPLTEEAKPKAHEIYTEMLAWTATAGVTNELGAKGQMANFKVMTQEEQHLQTRLKTLGNLSDKFFMSGQHTPKAAVTEASLAQMQQANMSKATMPDAFPKMTEGEQILNNLEFDVQQDLGQKMNQDSSQDMLMKNNLEASPKSLDAKVLDEALIADVQTEMSVEKAATELDAMDVAPDDELLQIQKMLKNLNNSAEDVVESTQEGISVANKDAASSLGAETEGDSADSQMNQGPQVLGNNAKDAQGVKSEFAKMMTPPSRSEMNENMTNIMNRAQSMVRDGGGEMKVRLNPEGMGEVSLKVVVNKGEVQIEMMAADNNTKKLLEKGLVDLKEGLMNHKLQVDNIKVETAQQTMNDFMSDQRDSAERQFQQKFLQDFMHNNRQGREGLMGGFGSIQRPSSQTGDEAINGLYDSSSRKADSNRKLDLVA